MQAQTHARWFWYLPEGMVAFLPLYVFLALKGLVGIPDGLFTFVPVAILSIVSFSIVHRFVPASYQIRVWLLGYFAVGLLRSIAKVFFVQLAQ